MAEKEAYDSWFDSYWEGSYRPELEVVNRESFEINPGGAQFPWHTATHVLRVEEFTPRDMRAEMPLYAGARLRGCASSWAQKGYKFEGAITYN